MPFQNSHFIACALFAGLIAVPGAALAQTADPATPPAAQQQTQQPAQPGTEAQTEGQADEQTGEPSGDQTGAAAPTGEQLESFAAATIDIVQIQETAQKQMQDAVAKAGLTIDEYNQIAQLAQSDPEVDEALQKLIKDRLGG